MGAICLDASSLVLSIKSWFKVGTTISQFGKWELPEENVDAQDRHKLTCQACRQYSSTLRAPRDKAAAHTTGSRDRTVLKEEMVAAVPRINSDRLPFLHARPRAVPSIQSLLFTVSPTFSAQAGYPPSSQSSRLFSAGAPVPDHGPVRTHTSATIRGRRVSSKSKAAASQPSSFSVSQNERIGNDPSQPVRFKSKLFTVTGGSGKGENPQSAPRSLGGSQDLNYDPSHTWPKSSLWNRNQGKRRPSCHGALISALRPDHNSQHPYSLRRLAHQEADGAI
ncbi:unnamed protein product [Pleuronectes platessa]|uniref:Uncharacterized protein n=1 Tax=Pleuronectes platessa TaxID=8262 RepID=A0A9N7Z1Q0_PLEPL|nr:unnamed protein product [Pleuronectes platessa]